MPFARLRRNPWAVFRFVPLAAVPVLLAFWSPGSPLAQDSPFVVEAEALRLRAEPARAEVRFSLDVPSGHYLYRHMLSVVFPDSTLFAVESIEYPEPKIKYDPFLEEETGIYEHAITVHARVALAPGAEFPDSIRAVFGYQGCTSEFCYFPQEVDLALAWRWKEEAPAVPKPEGERSEAKPSAAPPAAPGSFDVGERIASRGLLFTYLAVFLSGILLSFTPCVFPMIPITLSIIGARGEKRPFRGFLLSLVYVLGMALTYAVLGLVAATTGAMFGSILQNPYFVAALAAIFIALALSMFGLFELQVPSSLAVRLQKAGGGGGWIGIFLMGIIAGLVASPCVGPVLVGLLVYIAQTGSAVLGFTLLFTLALGIGVLFLVIGTFSGLIGALPGAGDWMDAVKRFFGFLLLGAALYFATPFLPPKAVLTGWGLLLLLGASFFGLFEGLPSGAGAFRRIAKALVLLVGVSGIVVLVASLVLPLLPFPVVKGTAPAAERIAWVRDYEAGMAEASRTGKPVVIDFTADWCAACRELEHKTYTDPGIIRESGRFVAILVDCTRSSERLSGLLGEYGVRGLPTVVFIDSSGRRMENLTVTGFVEPGPFLGILRSVG